MNISADEFAAVSKLVRTESAIVLEPGKEYLVEARLLPVQKEAGFESLGALIGALAHAHNSGLRKKVVHAMTTNETSFFRDSEPFQVFEQTVLPAAIERNRAGKSLTIWSAACSTGQEAYSVSMIIREKFPELLSWNLKVFGTDLSSAVVEKARAGAFVQAEVNRGLPAPYLIKYFERRGTSWAVKQTLRDMVRFEELNLLGNWTQVPPCDVVFLRNVLIYFDPQVKKEILGKVKRVLRPGGHMFLGAAETTMNLDADFERSAGGKGNCYTVKRPEAARPAAAPAGRPSPPLFPTRPK